MMTAAATTVRSPVTDPDSAAAGIATTSPWVLEAEKLVQRYHDPKAGRERTILDQLDFRMRPGTFCSLVGPSGCGKSTFLRLVLGAERPKGGVIRIFGAVPRLPDRHRGIVYQKYSLFPHLTVIENVVMGLILDQTSPLGRLWLPWYYHEKKRFLKVGAEYLESVGLAEHAGKFPHQLSGGQQQRVAIAQALINKPRIMLMDEPFGALDPGTRERLQRWLMEIQAREATSVFFVTHDLEEAVMLGDRVVVLSQFHTPDSGPPREGARIVADLDVKACKNDAETLACIHAIREIGFNKDRPTPESKFRLEHVDAVGKSDSTQGRGAATTRTDEGGVKP